MFISPKKSSFFGLVFLFQISGILAQAQTGTSSESAYPVPVGDWRVLSSYNYVQNLTTDGLGRVWGATTGGIFIWSVEAKQYEHYLTPVEGLSRLDPSVIAYHASKNLIVAGYPDGGLDVIDPERLTVRSLNDIKRTTLYTDKQIYSIEFTTDGVLVATGFGIVKFDSDLKFVDQTFSKLGSFSDGISVRDIVLDIQENEIWVTTDQGLAIANLSDDLSVESNWGNVSSDNFGGASAIRMALFQNKIYVTTSDGNFERIREPKTIAEGDWLKNQTFGSVTIEDFYVDQQSTRLYALYRFTLFYLDENLKRQSYTIPELGSAVIADQNIWVGSFQSGLLSVDKESGTTEVFEGNGPSMNALFGMRFTSTGFISASTRFSNRTFLFDDLKGFSKVENGNWVNYNMTNQKVLRDTDFTLVFKSLIGQEHAYFGSWGGGIAQLDLANDEIVVFNAENTSIRGANESDYIVISGLEKDSNQEIWAISRYASRPLIHHIEGSNEWTPLPPSATLSSADRYMSLFIDSNDQKWVTLESTSEAGRGLMVLDTGVDPLSSSDDQAVVLTTGSGSGNLPDATVTAIVEDLNGEIWIGTERGIAKFVFPDLILDGGPAERQAQWLIAADPGDISPFLLRDISVTAMVVNGANQKWVGSTSDGLWLLNEEGSRVLAHYTSLNSPLLSNTIDDLSYNPQTGELFITTNLGVIVLTDVATQGKVEMSSLSAYPNPFVYDRHERVIVEGLSERSTLFVVTVDGERVRRLETVGGRVEWDGLDLNGNKVASGVYLLIAIDENGGERGTGKLVVIR
jgi:ligand-binding sensor domain-containing protein